MHSGRQLEGRVRGRWWRPAGYRRLPHRWRRDNRGRCRLYPGAGRRPRQRQTMTAPAGPPNRTSRRRIGALLAIELVALCLVVASAPAAWIWLDGARPSDVIAGASVGPGASNGATAGPPGARGAPPTRAPPRPPPTAP